MFDHLFVIPYSGSIQILDQQLQVLGTWTNAGHPINVEKSVILDSFLVAPHFIIQDAFHVINVYTQESFDIEGLGVDIIDMQSRNDILFVSGEDIDGVTVLQFDETFNVLSESPLDLPKPESDFSFTYYPDRVYAWRTDGLSGYQANYRVVYQYANANPVRLIDLSLDSMWVDSIYEWPPEYHSPPNYFFRQMSLTIHLILSAI